MPGKSALRFIIHTMQMDLEAGLTKTEAGRVGQKGVPSQPTAAVIPPTRPAVPPQPKPQKSLRTISTPVSKPTPEIKPETAIKPPVIKKKSWISKLFTGLRKPSKPPVIPAAKEMIVPKPAQKPSTPTLPPKEKLPTLPRPAVGTMPVRPQTPLTPPTPPTEKVPQVQPETAPTARAVPPEVHLPYAGRTTTEADIELRPIFPKIPKVIKPTPIKPGQLKGPPLRPIFTHSRELENVPRVPPKRIRLKPKYLIGGAIAAVVIIGGIAFYQMGGIDYITSLFSESQKPPTIPTSPSTTPPKIIKPEPTLPLSIQSTIALDIAPANSQLLKEQLQTILARNLQLGSLHQITIKSPEAKTAFTTAEFFQVLNIIPPFGLIDSIEPKFTFLVHGGLIRNSFVIIFGIQIDKAGEDFYRLSNQLSSWEAKFTSDWKPLFSQDIQLFNSGSTAEFRNITINNQPTRFSPVGTADSGVYYTILAQKNLLIIAASKESIQDILKALLES